MDTQIEFCCGLAKKGKDLLISFGYQDNAAYILKMPNKVLDLLTYVDLDKDTKFDCKYEEFSWEFNEPYLSKIINQEIFTDNIYQKYSKVQEGDIVVDIGANVGAFSYLALKKNIKHLYSIEPSRLLLPTLIKNIGESNKVDIVNYRIGNYEEDKVVLQKDDGINIYDNANSTFDTITFTNFIEKYKIKKIDFLKCDCEGGEYSVFTEDNFDWIYNNVKKIAGEFHLWGIPDALENFYKFKNKYLIDGVTYFVEDREGNNVTSKMLDNQWLEDFSWNNQGGAQLNVYIEYGRK
jgi:FkbM family methyltransferase